MGLEKYGMILHDEVYHTEQLTCLEVNGVKRYVTGLNEFAPEVKTLPKREVDFSTLTTLHFKYCVLLNNVLLFLIPINKMLIVVYLHFYIWNSIKNKILNYVLERDFFSLIFTHFYMCI